MTEEDLKAIERRLEANLAWGPGNVTHVFKSDIRALIAEVRRLRELIKWPAPQRLGQNNSFQDEYLNQPQDFSDHTKF